MNDVLNLLGEYRSLITVIIAVIGYVIYDYKTAMRELKKFALSAMLRAEKWANKQIDVHGEEIMDKVVDIIYDDFVVDLHPWIRNFFTKEKIRNIAQYLYDKAKEHIYIE